MSGLLYREQKISCIVAYSYICLWWLWPVAQSLMAGPDLTVGTAWSSFNWMKCCISFEAFRLFMICSAVAISESFRMLKFLYIVKLLSTGNGRSNLVALPFSPAFIYILEQRHSSSAAVSKQNQRRTRRKLIPKIKFISCMLTMIWKDISGLNFFGCLKWVLACELVLKWVLTW